MFDVAALNYRVARHAQFLIKSCSGSLIKCLNSLLQSRLNLYIAASKYLPSSWRRSPMVSSVARHISRLVLLFIIIIICYTYSVYHNILIYYCFVAYVSISLACEKKMLCAQLGQIVGYRAWCGGRVVQVGKMSWCCVMINGDVCVFIMRMCIYLTKSTLLIQQLAC